MPPPLTKGKGIKGMGLQNHMEDMDETRQERREKKLRKERERIKKSGRNLAQIYRDAIMKRLRRKRGE